MAEIGKDINKAKQLLEEGQLVAIPTETVYGLAANATDDAAVTGIFKAKNRPYFDPLIIHVASLEQAIPYIEGVSPQVEALTEAFWPGPLTILLGRNNTIPDLVTAGLPTVGIRCPDHALTRQLLERLDFPLAAPSANPFGYVSPTTPMHVQKQLGDKIPYILEGGSCRVGIESTIVGFHNGRCIVYRIGGLKLEDLETVIGKTEVKTFSSSNPRAPGQLESHYAPAKIMVIGNLEELIQQHQEEAVGVLSFQRDYHIRHQVVLSRSGNVDEAARNLFAGLRTLDQLPVTAILAELAPDEGLGRAINDRLKRAAFRH